MQSATASLSFTGKIALAMLALLLVTLAVYWPGLKGPFVLDDMQNIVTVHIDHMDWSGFIYSITHNTSGMLGRVVSITSFVLSDLEFGLSSWGYKFHNLLLHLGCGLLLFFVVVQTLKQMNPAEDRQRHLYCAGLVSAFWLLHPLQVSTVLYVVQRMSILASMFTLAALLCYLAAQRQPTANRRYWLLAFVFYPMFQALAVFSKETGVLLPLYVLVFELLVFRSLYAPRLIPRRHQLFLLLFVLLPLLAGGLYLATHFHQIADYSTRNFTLGDRLLTQLHVVPTYIRMILLPRLKLMSLYHDDFPLTTSMDPMTLALLVLMLAMVAGVWLLRNRAPVLAFGLAWFLVAQLLESTIIPLEMMFEHRNYLAVAGLLLPVVYYAVSYKEHKLGIGVLALFMLVFTFQTWSRVLEWSDEELLNEQAVADHPGSGRAHTTLANLLTIKGDYPGARAQLEAAVKINPMDAGPLLHELTILCAQSISEPELVRKTATVLSTYPVSVYAMNSFEHLYTVINSGDCKKVSKEDMGSMLSAALSQPGNNRNALIKGYLLRLQGFQALMSGEYAPGVVYMRMAYDTNKDAIILSELVESQLNYGRFQDAEDTLELLREINRQHFGTENYQVSRLEKLIKQKRENPDKYVPDETTAAVPPATSLP